MNTLHQMKVPRSYIEPNPILGRTEHCTLDNFTGQDILIARLKDLALTQRSIIISGKTSGIGKSHLLVGYMLASFKTDVIRKPKYDVQIFEQAGEEVARQIENGYTESPVQPEQYYYTRADDLIESLIKSGFDAAVNFGNVFKYRCLAIDEFGRDLQGYGKDVLDDAPTMNRLLGGRIDDLRQIVIATPLDKAEFVQKYDGSLLRRLEDNGGEWIDLKIERRYQGR